MKVGWVISVSLHQQSEIGQADAVHTLISIGNDDFSLKVWVALQFGPEATYLDGGVKVVRKHIMKRH